MDTDPTEPPLGECRPPELTSVVRLFVPDDDPVEIELDIHPDDFLAAMREQVPNGLVIAEDRHGIRWFCAYRSIHSVDAKG